MFKIRLVALQVSPWFSFFKPSFALWSKMLIVQLALISCFVPTFLRWWSYLKSSWSLGFGFFLIFPMNSLVHCFSTNLLFINLPDTVQEHNKSLQHIVVKSHVCASSVYIPRINCYVVTLWRQGTFQQWGNLKCYIQYRDVRRPWHEKKEVWHGKVQHCARKPWGFQQASTPITQTVSLLLTRLCNHKTILSFLYNGPLGPHVPFLSQLLYRVSRPWWCDQHVNMHVFAA